MAQGDPMILQTHNLTDYGGFEAAGSGGVAVGWTGLKTGTADYTASVIAGGQKGNCQRLVMAGGAAGGTVSIHTSVMLIGRDDLAARGHYQATVVMEVYARGLAGTTFDMDLEEYDSNNILLARQSSTKTITTSDVWLPYNHTYGITQTSTASVRLVLRVTLPAQESRTYLFDSLTFAERYVFAKNPSMPEQATYDMETREFRDSERRLWQYTLGGAKLSGALNWGLITEGQMLALRSLWLWNKTLTWTPNLNKLPATIDIRLGKNFDFNAVSSNLGAGYRGTLSWQEV